MSPRYRILHSHLDLAEIARETAEAVVNAGTLENPHDEVGTALAAVVDAPKRVEADEHEASLEELRALVRSGKLRPRDLVNTGDGWVSVEDSPVLIDDVDAIRGGHSRGRVYALGALAAIAIAAGAYLFLSR